MMNNKRKSMLVCALMSVMLIGSTVTAFALEPQTSAETSQSVTEQEKPSENATAPEKKSRKDKSATNSDTETTDTASFRTRKHGKRKAPSQSETNGTTDDTTTVKKQKHSRKNRTVPRKQSDEMITNKDTQNV